MRNDKRHKLIQEFIKLSGLSNRRFAMLAGIAPSTFQAMLDRNSSIKHDTFIQIQSAMENVLNTAVGCVDEATLRKLKSLYSFICSTTTAAQIQEFVNIFGEDVMINLEPLDPAEAESLSKDARVRLNNAFDSLNKKGQEIAAERVEELTKIPEYRKDED